MLDVYAGASGGEYVVVGYNEDGQEYKTAADGRYYDSANGGIVDSEDTTPKSTPAE